MSTESNNPPPVQVKCRHIRSKKPADDSFGQPCNYPLLEVDHDGHLWIKCPQCGKRTKLRFRALNQIRLGPRVESG